MFRILIGLFFTSFFLVFAGEKYGVYDLQGNRVSTFEAEPYNLLEKAQQVKAIYPSRNLYVSSLSKGKSYKASSRYRYKAEIGAYIEATRKEIFSVCSDQEIQGTWISEHSVALDEKNCLSIRSPNLAGTFRILFLQNNGRMDTIQVFVEQSYVQMGDYSHKVWVTDSPSASCNPNYGDGVAVICEAEAYGHYENRKYEQALIVDKTEFTMGDAWQYSEFGLELDRWLVGPLPNEIPIISNSGEPVVPLATKIYPPKEDLKTSMRPYIERVGTIWQFANMRSKLEGLDTVYRYTISVEGNRKLMMDTSTNGYRLPFNDEWGMLMRAGASTRYYWGDEEDSLTISRYTTVRPIGYIQHKVAQKLPNAFGLYDMISPNNTSVSFGEICVSGRYDQMRECRFLEYEVARRVKDNSIKLCEINGTSKTEKCKETFTSYFRDTSARFLRKTPKLHKLEKF